MGLRRPTLDDVFLQLTGEPPSENGKPHQAAAGPDEKLIEHAPRLRPVHAPSLRDAEAGVTDTAVVTTRNLRHFWRQPDLLVFSTIQPIMFVVLFVYVFGGAVGLALPPGVSYVDYLLPGIFVQSVTFRASNTAVGLSEDLRRGVIDRFRSMPMARSAVLLGRTTADLVRNVLIIVLMIVVGYLVGFRFQAGVIPALGVRRSRRRLRVCPQLDLRLRLLGRPRCRDRADGRLRAAVSARLRQLGLRPGLDAAELAAADRRSLAGDADRGRGAHPRAHRRRADSLGARSPGSSGILALFVPLSVWRYRRMS
jgi:hypothetical protein